MDDRLQKEFSVHRVGRVGDHWQVKEMEMRDDKTDARTLLEFRLEG